MIVVAEEIGGGCGSDTAVESYFSFDRRKKNNYKAQINIQEGTIRYNRKMLEVTLYWSSIPFRGE